jgi:hypothetical protein
MSSDTSDTVEVYISSGANVAASLTLTDKDGNSLAGATVDIGVSDLETPPSVWTPANITYLTAESLIAEFRINSTIAQPSKEACVWYRMTIGVSLPQVEIHATRPRLRLL